jgi:hypothetical protein
LIGEEKAVIFCVLNFSNDYTPFYALQTVPYRMIMKNDIYDVYCFGKLSRDPTPGAG